MDFAVFAIMFAAQPSLGRQFLFVLGATAWVARSAETPQMAMWVTVLPACPESAKADEKY
jgi:hypothetical protein